MQRLSEGGGDVTSASSAWDGRDRPLGRLCRGLNVARRSVDFRRGPVADRDEPELNMTRQQVLDLYFMENRAKLIDLAAFLDRVDRAEGEADFRLGAFGEAMRHLAGGSPDRAKNVLLALSDPTAEPVDKAPGKGAIGAWKKTGH